MGCPGGGMVDTVDSKSAARKGVRVQVPPGVLEDGRLSAGDRPFFVRGDTDHYRTILGPSSDQERRKSLG